MLAATSARSADGHRHFARTDHATLAHSASSCCPARRTRIRHDPAAGATAATARVGGPSGTSRGVVGARRAIRRCTCNPIRSGSTTSRRHYRSWSDRCC